ncbi:MAG: hypothetical protein J6R68_03115 [Clostridia bacterium]|nr:hypothetical protein [Clostridia bacterium]
MDSFMEYMISEKQTAKTVFKKIGIYFAALLLAFVSFIVMLMFPSMLIGFLPMVIVLIFYAAYRINTSFDVEYEYILTNGELDIDKITNKRRRKRLMTIHCKSFTAFAKKGDKEFLSEENGEFARVIDASAKSSALEDYYAVFYKNGQKIKLVFNPTQKMIETFKIYAPRVVK